MGYETWHNLKVHSEKEKEIIAELRAEDEDAHDAFDSTGDGQEWIKWYDYFDDANEGGHANAH